MVGLSPDDLAGSREANSSDGKADAALKFAREIVVRRGELQQSDLDAVRAAGYGDAEVIEIIAQVALNIFTNYFNHIAQTDIDFPRVRAAKSAA